MLLIPLKCKKPVSKEVLDKYKDIQVIDSSLVAGEGHLAFAISQAKKAFKRRENISDNFFIEILVRASGQRQIKKAFELFGLKDSKEVVVLCEEVPRKFLKDYGCEKAKFEISEEKYAEIKRIFNIEEREIQAITSHDFQRVKALKEIVKERIALIPVL
jgi:tRNA threonylcarbamoyladenosine modification (KEOPS) complex Cgi121 subunit